MADSGRGFGLKVEMLDVIWMMLAFVAAACKKTFSAGGVLQSFVRSVLL